TGSVRIVSDPTSTSTIEITMATMGRLMKNLDMPSPPLGVPSERFSSHQNAVTDFLYPFGDDGFAEIKSFGDDPILVNAVADFYGPNADLVFGIYDSDLIGSLKI